MEVLLGHLFSEGVLAGGCRQDWLREYDKPVCLFLCMRVHAMHAATQPMSPTHRVALAHMHAVRG
jgi:hypothetical protein